VESAGSERPPFERLAVETRRLVYKHRFAEVVESRTRVPIVDVSEYARLPTKSSATYILRCAALLHVLLRCCHYQGIQAGYGC